MQETPSWCDVRAVDRAAASCARRKQNRPETVAFRMRHGEEVIALSERLRSGRYQPEPGWVFVTDQPKPREIHAALFRDRVVHHLLHALLEPKFEPGFIGDSYACRQGKGTHAAARALQGHLWDATRHGQVRAWVLQLDVRNFFASIHRPTLLHLLQGRVDPEHWQLVRKVVLHDAAKVAVRRGAAASFALVPPQKRLGALGPDRGLPIGNLTSQFFANVYLNALDQFIKRRLGARHFVRYVDDFVLVHREPDVLRRWEAEIREFLSARLMLEAHPAPKLLAASEGVDFVGYIVRPGYLLPRRRVVRALQRKLRVAEAELRPRWVSPRTRLLVAPIGQLKGPATVQRLPEASLESLRAIWASYQGHLAHANAWRLMHRLWLQHPVSRSVLLMRAGRVVGRLSRPRPVATLREQRFRLRKGVDADLVLVKVGRFAVADRCAALTVGFRQARNGRRRGLVAPWLSMNGVLRRALRAGLRVAIALELPFREGNLRARRLSVIVRPGPLGVPSMNRRQS